MFYDTAINGLFYVLFIAFLISINIYRESNIVYLRFIIDHNYKPGKMKKSLLICFIGACVTMLMMSFRSIEEGNTDKIQWITIEEAFEKSQKEPKKILVDIYTDWCGWCKVMDKQTFTNKGVVSYINKNFYAVKFDAEQRKSIVLGDEKFDFLARGGKGVHELALRLTNNQPSYPTTVFLDEKLRVIQPVPGFMKAREFHEVITYFGGDFYKSVPFEQYKTDNYSQLFPNKP